MVLNMCLVYMNMNVVSIFHSDMIPNKYSELSQKTGFQSVTIRGIVPMYITYRVKTWYKKNVSNLLYIIKILLDCWTSFITLFSKLRTFHRTLWVVSSSSSIGYFAPPIVSSASPFVSSTPPNVSISPPNVSFAPPIVSSTPLNVSSAPPVVFSVPPYISFLLLFSPLLLLMSPLLLLLSFLLLLMSPLLLLLSSLLLLLSSWSS